MKDDDSDGGRRLAGGLADDARRLILARRARFIAAALASAGLAAPGCGGDTECGAGSCP